MPRGQRSKVPDHWVHILDHVKDMVPPVKEWVGIKAAVQKPAFEPATRSFLDLLVLKGAPKKLQDFHHRMNAYEIRRAEMVKQVEAMDLLNTNPVLDNAVKAALDKVPDFNKEFKELVEKSPALSVISKCNYSALNDADWKFLVANI